jgi:hypothetical protein
LSKIQWLLGRDNEKSFLPAKNPYSKQPSLCFIQCLISFRSADKGGNVDLRTGQARSPAVALAPLRLNEQFAAAVREYLSISFS